MERCHPAPLSLIDKSVILGAWLPDDLLSPGLGMGWGRCLLAYRSIKILPVFSHIQTIFQLSTAFSPNPHNLTRPLGSDPKGVWVVERTQLSLAL